MLSSRFAASAFSRIRMLAWSSIDVRMGFGVEETSGRSAIVAGASSVVMAGVVAASVVSCSVAGSEFAGGEDFSDFLFSFAACFSSFLAAFSSAAACFCSSFLSSIPQSVCARCIVCHYLRFSFLSISFFSLSRAFCSAAFLACVSCSSFAAATRSLSASAFSLISSRTGWTFL